MLKRHKRLTGWLVVALLIAVFAAPSIAGWDNFGPWDTIVRLLSSDQTWTGTQTFDTVDINGGAIDATTIGGSTPAAGGFTSITSPYVTITYGATVDFDWALGNNQEVELAGDPTFTFSNIPDGAWLKVRIVQDGTGSRSVTWPGTAKWPGGVEPTLTTTGAAIDILSFVSDGTNLEAFGFAADIK